MAMTNNISFTVDTFPINDCCQATITTGTTNSAVILTANDYYYTTTTTGTDWHNVIQSWKDLPLTTIVPNSTITYYNNTKDEKEMNNINLDFGAYNTNSIRMSLYGMAIKNKSGKWVSYDKKTHRLMDVEVLNFNINAKDIFYKIPVALDKVKVGDIILHNDKLVFIEAMREDGKFEVIDPYEGTAITILAPMSPFGFNYLIQIVCLMDVLPEASAENPFGSFLPFILGGDNNSLPLIMAMTGNSFDDIDPMMMIALCGKGDMSTYILMQMLTKKKNKKEIRKDFVNKFNEAKNRHAMYGPGIEDMDE